MSRFLDYFRGSRGAAERPRDYPSTYRPGPADPRLSQPKVFEPALSHFLYAYRAGEPAFSDADVERRWRLARRRAMEHVLFLAVTTAWGDQLVLRGSMAMRAWFGTAAREPNDLDFVCTPPAGKQVAEAALTGLIEAATRNAASGNGGGAESITLHAHDVPIDSIWTYDRVPGWRIVLPWTAAGLPGGHVQVDIVGGEPLPAPPIETDVPLIDGGRLPVRTASTELSLAWKLLWLHTDRHPQGKDMYDAVLLAERLTADGTPLPWSLLYDVVAAVDPRAAQRLSPDALASLAVDWQNFRLEYPSIEGSEASWRGRLCESLRPTFEER